MCDTGEQILTKISGIHFIYLYRSQGHNSFLTHFDFAFPSAEGAQYAQSTCGGYELLFWDVAEPKVNLL